MKSYRELIHYATFEERLKYLKMDSKIGERNFDVNRYWNQKFYRSYEWQKIRRDILIRDNACDLGIRDRPLETNIFIHHINPINDYDLHNNFNQLIDPDNLICVSFDTHNMIHYGNDINCVFDLNFDRMKGDTNLW